MNCPIILWFPRNLDPDWLQCWTLIFSNSVVPSAVTWKLKTPRNTALNQRSCWTNWQIFTCSWIVRGSLKPSLTTRSVPGVPAVPERVWGQAAAWQLEFAVLDFLADLCHYIAICSWIPHLKLRKVILFKIWFETFLVCKWKSWARHPGDLSAVDGDEVAIFLRA